MKRSGIQQKGAKVLGLIESLEKGTGSPLTEMSGPYRRVLSKLDHVKSVMSETEAAVRGVASGEKDEGEAFAMIAELLVDVAGLYYGFGKLLDPRDNAYPRPPDFLEETDEWKMWIGPGRPDRV